MTRLPAVLTRLDLPEAELNAARLDGEVYRVDGAYSPIDEVEQPRHRASALATGLPHRIIAEQRSAAWVWGAATRPPSHHQFCVGVGARVRPPGVPWMSVREVVIEDADIATIGDLRLTLPLRTVVDLARFSEHFTDDDLVIVSALMRIGGLCFDECAADLERRRNLPNKRRALDRLRRCG